MGKKARLKKLKKELQAGQKAGLPGAALHGPDKRIKMSVVAVLLIVLFGFAVYANVLNGKFIYDDEYLIKNNIYIKTWDHILNIFKEDVGSGGGKKFSFYRPLQLLTYLVDHTLWKLAPAGYHLTNIILHITAALCIYLFIGILYGNSRLSLCSALLFVSHPVNTEAVAYVSGRTDPMALIFIMLCLVLYIKQVRGGNAAKYVSMIICYLAALLTREHALILPVLVLLYHFVFKEKLKTKEFLTLLCISCVYIIFRVTALKSLSPHLICHTTVLERIPGFFVALSRYAQLLVLPFNLHMEYGNRLFPFSDPRVFAGIAILLAAIAVAFIRRNDKVIFFSVAWFFLTLLPMSNIYPLNAYMAEHWLYLPLLGFILPLAKGLDSIYEKREFRTIAVIITASILAFYSCLAVRQADYWKEPIKFYETTLKYSPDNAKILTNLGIEYCKIGKIDESIVLLKKSAELDSGNHENYNNLGLAYKKSGRNKEAMEMYGQAIKMTPDDPSAYNNLGVLYDGIGKTKEAVVLYRKAISINPYYAEAYNNLAIAFYSLGQFKEAESLFKKALKLNPDYAEAKNNLEILRRKKIGAQ